MLRPAFIAVLALLVLPGVAEAATVNRQGEEINYVTPGPGAVDNLVLRQGNDQVVFSGPQVSPGPPFCDGSAGAFTATCTTRSDFPITVQIDLGDRDETVTVTNPFSLMTTVNGGIGNETLTMGDERDVLFAGQDEDRLFAGGNNDNLFAGPGNDELDGGPGNDFIDGGEDNDVIDPPNGADQIQGGSGTDTVIFGPGNDTITLDGQANDGTPGQNAFLGNDIEILDGGAGNDSIAGNANANTLTGGVGSDDLHGGAGIDTVSYPDAGNQRITLDDVADDGLPGEGDNVHSDIENVAAGAGNDLLIGNAGDNVLDGGPGNDELRGGPGVDTFLGGPGDDTIRARDAEAESVDCGAEGGTAIIDTIDTAVNCTHVDASDELLPDHDGDGVDHPPNGPDCNDRNAAIHPGAPEILNNAVDENCDGRADFDRDGDHFLAPRGGRDCDDTNARIHPGAREIPGNKADEDCDGHADPFPLLGSALGAFTVTDSHGTRFTDLFVRRAEKGSTVRLRCSGPGCGKRTRTLKVRRDRQTLKLLKLVRGLELRPGARLEVRITKRATIGAVIRLTMRRGKAPARRDACLFPGHRAPRRCPG
jgi:putative metal-binding protein/hemolysin type calcium-binding protein